MKGMERNGKLEIKAKELQQVDNQHYTAEKC